MSKTDLKRKSPQRKKPVSDASATSVKTSGEPWFSKTQKIVAAIVSCLVLAGMIWNYGAKADARYAKEAVVSKEISQVKTDLAMLGKAFQSEQLDRSISNKQDLLLKVNLRLREKISPAERAQLEEVKRALEKELEQLKERQKKIDGT